jgi:hypothetical protein
VTLNGNSRCPLDKRPRSNPKSNSQRKRDVGCIKKLIGKENEMAKKNQNI